MCDGCHGISNKCEKRVNWLDVILHEAKHNCNCEIEVQNTMQIIEFKNGVKFTINTSDGSDYFEGMRIEIPLAPGSSDPIERRIGVLLVHKEDDDESSNFERLYIDEKIIEGFDVVGPLSALQP